MKTLMIATAISLLATSALAAPNPWVGPPSQAIGDKCKTNAALIYGAVPGAGYTVIWGQKFAPGSFDFSLCVRRNSNTTYELWQFQSTADKQFCRTATRTGMNSTCSNNTLP